MTDVDTLDNENNPEKNKPEDNKPVLWRWQHILTIIVFILTTLIAIYLGFFKGENKRIDFTCVSEYRIADIDKELHKDLKLLFKEEPISNASLIIFSCKNSGNTNIFYDKNIQKAQHLIPKINIAFTHLITNKARILSHNVKKSDKSTTLTYIQEESSPSSVTYGIELLNKKAEVEIQLVVANYEGSFYDVEATGLGIKSRAMTDKKFFHITSFLSSLAFMISGACFIYAIQRILHDKTIIKDISRKLKNDEEC